MYVDATNKAVKFVKTSKIFNLKHIGVQLKSCNLLILITVIFFISLLRFSFNYWVVDNLEEKTVLRILSSIRQILFFVIFWDTHLSRLFQVLSAGPLQNHQHLLAGVSHIRSRVLCSTIILATRHTSPPNNNVHSFAPSYVYWIYTD